MVYFSRLLIAVADLTSLSAHHDVMTRTRVKLGEWKISVAVLQA